MLKLERKFTTGISRAALCGLMVTTGLSQVAKAAKKGPGPTSPLPATTSPAAAPTATTAPAATITVAPAPIVTPTPPGTGECVVFEDFSGSTENSFPRNWQSRYDHNQKEAEDKKLWAVTKDGDRKVLHAIYGTHTITVVRKIEGWDMDKYPFLEWEWKAVKLPTGGDEASSGKNDSAASLYLVFEESWPMKGSFLRFAWSSTQPINSIISKRLGYEKIVITESGAALLNTWKKERVNARELAKKELKKGSGKSPILLALNTDADGTHSSAEAYYANFRFCK